MATGPSLINGLGGTEGFGENVLPPNDDGSTSAINVTAVFDTGLNFFGTTYNSIYINNNGNITFTEPLGTFTPGEITAGNNSPIIAPFWADVDTRGGPGVSTGGNATGSNTVYYDLDTANDVVTVTWNDVGYYSGHQDKLNAFQLQLIDRGDGDFDILFRYQAVYWTTGDASGGENGLGGTPARAGYSAGDGLHAYELPQSGDQDSMLGLPFTPAPSGTQGVTGETGVYLFEVRNGVVIPPPPTNLVLSPNSDSGEQGDNITNVTTPIITGLGISGFTITLSDGETAVGTATVALDGTWAVATSPLSNGVHNLTATQTDTTDVSSSQSAPLALTIASTSEPQLFSFLFTFGDGSDYYFGTVVDDGRYGYTTGQIINTLSTAGRYDILGNLGTTTQPVGTVIVATYSHGGPGQALTTPVNTAAGIPSGMQGLGSESDAVPGLDGQNHPFNNALEAEFVTTSAFGFVYTYADNAAFYSGTVADDGRFGVTAGSRLVFDASGNFLGSYLIFNAGQTVRAPGTVVVDRFTAGGTSFVPNHAEGAVDGLGGLGSEVGSINVNGETLLFSNLAEPFIALRLPTVAAAPSAGAPTDLSALRDFDGNDLGASAQVNAWITDDHRPLAPAMQDFTGDGTSDVLWQNNDGTPSLWTIQGTSITGIGTLPNPGLTWRTVGTGTFSGSGRPEILFQNLDWKLSIWKMNGTTLASSSTLPDDPGIGWKAVGIGDFNGDGHSDIVLRYSDAYLPSYDGTPAIWLMDGSTVVGSALLHNPGPSWHFIATADFNGDGHADILWQNDDGTPAIWEMNGTTSVDWAVLWNPGPNWHVLGAGDFNGDGKSDILFQNIDGTPAIWEMSGLNAIGGGSLWNIGSGWHITGTGDFNGDGRSDIFFQTANGAPYADFAAIWDMSGTSVIGGGTVGFADPNWHVAGTNHF